MACTKVPYYVVSISKIEPYRELNLPGRIGIVGQQKLRIQLKLAGIHLSLYLGRVGHELAGRVIKAVVGDDDSAVGAIGEVEGFGKKFEVSTHTHLDGTRDSRVSGEVVGTDKRIPLVTRQPVVVGVAILIRVSRHGCIERAAGAERDYAGKFPVVRQAIEQRVAELERTGLHDGRSQEAISLVRDTESALQRGGIDILNVAGTPHHQRILAVVDGFRKGVTDAEEDALVDLPFQRNRHAVVNTAGAALEGIDCA